MTAIGAQIKGDGCRTGFVAFRRLAGAIHRGDTAHQSHVAMGHLVGVVTHIGEAALAVTAQWCLRRTVVALSGVGAMRLGEIGVQRHAGAGRRAHGNA